MMLSKNPMNVPCDACGMPVGIFGTIRLGTFDPIRRYKASKRKMIMNYRWRLCPKHYQKALDSIKEAVEKI